MREQAAKALEKIRYGEGALKDAVFGENDKELRIFCFRHWDLGSGPNLRLKFTNEEWTIVYTDETLEEAVRPAKKADYAKLWQDLEELGFFGLPDCDEIEGYGIPMDPDRYAVEVKVGTKYHWYTYHSPGDQTEHEPIRKFVAGLKIVDREHETSFLREQ